MDKIKVSKEVATALDTALKVMDKEKFFEEHSNKFRWTLDIYLPLNQISNWKMAQILINDYQVQLTPEEGVKELYDLSAKMQEKFEVGSKNYYLWQGEARGIESCLNRLGIKIKGIND